MKETQLKTANRLEDVEKNIIAAMAQEFIASDEDGNGELEYEEFLELCNKETFGYKMRLIGIQLAEAEQIFQLMDADGSGTVTPEEFVSGLRKMKGEATG